MKHVTVALLLTILASPILHAQEEPAREPTRLSVGQVLADSLPPEESRVYLVELGADWFVYGEADQQTLDVVVEVTGPDGERVARFDGPHRGPEPFQFDAEAAGEYRIEVDGRVEEETGRYTLVLIRAEPVASEPEARVDQLMIRYTRDDAPGGVVGVVRDGELVFARAYGMANLTHDIPFTTGTVSNIGSTSKQFTAFAIALLAHRGELSLDDDVREHIPELPQFDQTVTLRNLLTHTSGYREFLNTLALAGRRIDQGDHIARDELIRIVQRQPELQNEPGAEWNYNNTAFGLLTVVVERITDRPFPEWMAENVFEPLGMEHTVVRAHPRQIIPNSAQGYTPAEGGGWREAGDLGAAMGAGGIYTTVADLARWIDNLETGRLGGEDVIRAMTTRFVLADGDTTDYGLGLMIDEHRGLRRIHHGGADIAHRSMLAYYPTLDGGVVTLSNNATFPGNIPWRVAEAFFGEAMEPEGGEPAAGDAGDFDPESYDPEDFDDFAGRYELEEAPGFVLTFSREDDELHTQATGQPQLEIVPTSDSTFALTGVEASVTFHRNEDGVVESLTLHQNGDHLARRLEEETWEPSEAELEGFAGRYFSEEILTFYTLEVEDEKLVLRHPRWDDVQLEPAGEDEFRGSFPVAEIRFERDGAGEVVALYASNGRTRGVRFEKVE